MTRTSAEQDKSASGSLSLVQALVNTQYGRGSRAHSELTNPEQLRSWLVTYDLLADGMPVTEGDLRRVLELREAIRSLLRANNDAPVSPQRIGTLNHLAGNAPLTVHFQGDGQAVLEPDISGVDGVLARILAIVFTAMTDGTWSRLKACRNEGCQKAFYDTSKNRSGTWCAMSSCGSRIKARAYRKRRNDLAASAKADD